MDELQIISLIRRVGYEIVVYSLDDLEEIISQMEFERKEGLPVWDGITVDSYPELKTFGKTLSSVHTPEQLRELLLAEGFTVQSGCFGEDDV